MAFAILRYGAGAMELDKDCSRKDMNSDRLVFLHIAKTAGTTLDHILKENFLPSEICPERLSGISAWSTRTLSKYKYFSAHDSFDRFNTYIPKPFQMVTVFREPIDRLISQYLYWRSHTDIHIEANNLHYPRLAREYSLKEFLKFPIPIVRTLTENVTAKYLTDHTMKNDWELWRDGDDQEMLDRALQNIAKIDVYGIAEFMDDSIDAICRHFDMAVPAVIPRLNETKNNKLDGTACFEEMEDLKIDDETEELLVRLNRLDTIIYNEAAKPFIERAKKDGRRLSGINSACGRTIAQYARTVFTAEPGEVGFLIFGPYIRLRRGSYTITVEVKLSDLPNGLDDTCEIGFIDVSSEKGAAVHARRTIRPGDVTADHYQKIHIDFSLEKTAVDLEVRIYTSGVCRFSANRDVRLHERNA